MTNRLLLYVYSKISSALVAKQVLFRQNQTHLNLKICTCSYGICFVYINSQTRVLTYKMV